MTGPLAQRLAAHTTPAPTGCWLWTGAIQSSGYGSIGVGTGRTALAHRVAYELAHGPIPAGQQIDHLCRVRACVNPAHLEAVTPAENVRRSLAARAVDGVRRLAARCKHGHDTTQPGSRGPDNYRQIAADLSAATNTPVTHETVRTWHILGTKAAS